jgi:hypothetical protein
MRIPALLLTLAFVAGCSVHIDTGQGSKKLTHLEVAGPHGAACAAIQAASSLDFSSDQKAAFLKIARQQNLSSHEQVYLVNAVLDTVDFSRDKAEVLVALAGNPTLHPEARAAIALRIEDVDFSSDKKKITEALAANPGMKVKLKPRATVEPKQPAEPEAKPDKKPKVDAKDMKEADPAPTAE